MHTAAQKLATTKFDSARAAFGKIHTSGYRAPENVARDRYRHPVETLEFFGLKPDMTVLEYGPGAGWYTELLAPMLAARGKLIATNSDPKGSPSERSTMYGRRFQLFLDTAPELYGKVEVVLVDGNNPSLGLTNVLDQALVIRGMHGWKRSGTVEAWLREIHLALKPGGVLGIVQHRAKAGVSADESAKDGYLPEAWVIEKVTAAGFALQEKSEINANPKDTTEHPAGVWTLPPSLRLGDQDREKYEAIGESDRMTLRFVKDPG
jgi:predicted methyltransferase